MNSATELNDKINEIWADCANEINEKLMTDSMQEELEIEYEQKVIDLINQFKKQIEESRCEKCIYVFCDIEKIIQADGIKQKGIS